MSHSHWIWIPGWNREDVAVPRIVCFRKTFYAGADIVKLPFRISADTRYKLYVNDHFVEFGPSRGDHSVWFYDEPDLLPYIRKGWNGIAVEVLRYPEDPDLGNHGMFRSTMPGLFAAGFAEDENGSRIDLSADSSWKCMKNPSVSFYREEERFAPLVIHEHVIGDAAFSSWRSVSCPDRNWENAVCIADTAVPAPMRENALLTRSIPFMRRVPGHFKGLLELEGPVEEAAVVRMLEGRDEVIFPPNTETKAVLDAGEEMTGFLRAAFSRGAGAEIEFLYAECYIEGKTNSAGGDEIPVKGDRMDCEHGYLDGYRDTYLVCRDGNDSEAGSSVLDSVANCDPVKDERSDRGDEEIFEPFWFRTFRMVKLRIRTKDEPLVWKRMDYEEVGYPLEVRSKVQTSDPTHGKIWKISERTLRRCMHETYEDCPYYEQLQYIMDTRSQILYTYAVSADDRLARKAIADIARSQRPDGLLNCSYPNCNTNLIPGFSIYYILMLHDHMMYFGDRDLVRRYMPVVRKILAFFESHLTKEGYVGKIGGKLLEGESWSFVDWAEEWIETGGMPLAGLKGPLTMESLLYVYGLMHAAELAEYVGDAAFSGELIEKAERVREALREHCVREDGMVTDGPHFPECSQHTQVFAALTDLLDPEDARRNLRRTLTEKGFAKCTVAMQFYLFRALEKTGLYEYTDECWGIWRRMVEQNCTTCVESEAYSRSECHGWGALMLYELPSVVLGVRPGAPGYSEIHVDPVPGYLTSASGEVITPRGIVHVSWVLKDGKPEIMTKGTGPFVTR